MGREYCILGTKGVVASKDGNAVVFIMALNNLRIGSFNTNGIRQKQKRSAIFQWLATLNRNILFLQETHSSRDIEIQWKSELCNKQLFFSHGTTAARRVCIALSDNIDVKIIEEISDDCGRFLLLHIEICNCEMVLANIYAPTKDKKQEQLAFMQSLRSTLTKFLDKPIILGGDFNTCLDPNVDKSGGVVEEQSPAAKTLIDVCKEFSLFDIYRFLNPQTKKYTWRNKGRPYLIQSRLDMFFISLQFQY